METTLGNIVGNTTEAVTTTTTTVEDYLFTSLNGYHVTISDLLIAIVIVILGIWIIVLNCILIHTMVRFRAQLDVTDSLINSLAAVDALIGVLLLYNSAYNIMNFQNIYECYIRFGFIQSLLVNSTGHIALLTVNRYIKIIRPFKYHEIFNKRRILISSLVVWCFSLVVGFLPLMGWHRDFTPDQTESETLVCRFFGIMDRHYISMNVAIFWITLMLMIVTYAHISKIAYRHSKAMSEQKHVSSMKRKPRMFDSRSWRLTKTVFIIIGVYFVCWMPTGVFFMVQQGGHVDHLSLTDQGNILVFTSGLGFVNSLVNPLIYATKIPCVKQRFKHIFCCKVERRQSIQATAALVTDNFRSLFTKRGSQAQVIDVGMNGEVNGEVNRGYSPQTSTSTDPDDGK